MTTINLKSLSAQPSMLHNIELYEPIHYNKLTKILNSTLVNLDSDPNWIGELKQLSKYAKNYNKTNNLVKVRYTRSDLVEFGRVNPDKALGLHSIRREVRHTLAKDLLVDIDIVNAHPVILNQLCEKFNYPNKCLNKYVNDREELIATYTSMYNTSRDDIKTLFIRLINNGSYKKWITDNNYEIEDDFLSKFNLEMKKISELVASNNPELTKYLKTIKNKKNSSSVIAYYLQTIECYILEEIFNYCRRSGIIKNVCVLSNDGIMIPVEAYKESLLGDFSKVIKDKYDINIKFITKPFNQEYTDEEIEKAQLGTKYYDNYFTELDLASHHFLAEKFIAIYDKDNYIYNTNTGWYIYDKYNVICHLGDKPPLSLSNDITTLIQQELKTTFVEMAKIISPEMPKFKQYNAIYKSIYRNVGSAKYKKGIIEELMIHFNDDDIEKKIDSNMKLVAFNNMLFDFNLKQYRDIQKDDYIMTTCGYNAPVDKNDIIRKQLKNIIKSIFEDDDNETYFMDTIGFSLFTNRFEKLHMWSGTGGNGKGLIMDLLNKSFGDYFFIPDSKFLTTKYRSNAPNPDLYKTKNKKLVMVAEPEGDNDGDVKFNIEFVKRLTGRDDITTRDLHKSSMTFKPKFTLFIQTNEMPKIEKVEQALSRRFMCLNFPFNFVEEVKQQHHRRINYELKDKISDAIYYTEFMGMLIDHIKDKIDDTLKVPNSIKEETNEYLNENNHVKKFLESYMILTGEKTDRMKLTDLFNLYKQNGDVVLTKTKFHYNLKQNNLFEKKINGTRYYVGIRPKVD